jgi:hypothetical protein
MESIKKAFIVKDFYLRHINDDDDLSVAIAGYLGEDSHVTIPKCIQNFHVKAIDEIAFLSTGSLKKVTIEQGVTFIGNAAFLDCNELTEVELPDGLLKIDYEAFTGCKKLAKIRFPESLLSIGSHAFGDCEELTSIFIPKKVQYLGGDEISGCFSGCRKLKEIIVDDDNPEFSSLDGVLFNKTKTLLIKYPEGKEDANYKVPDTIINVKDEAFNNCKRLVSITFPDVFLSLPANIFYGCKQLKKVTLSQETKIEPNAFFNSSVEFVTGIDKIALKKND